MKKSFSRSWIRSKKPNKQRKYRYNAPLHIRQRFANAHLSKELRQKYGFRSFRVVTGDKVRVLRGNYSGKSGKVEGVNLKKSEVFISSIELIKKAGEKKKIPVHISNLVIEELNLDDKIRRERIELKKLKEGKNDKESS
jgi:large subunit ribosomal protein L24